VRQLSAWLLVVSSTLAIAVAYLGMSVAGTLAVACAISVLGGAGNGVQWIAVMTALQEQTPQDFQARITGLMESIGAAMPGVGYLLGGAIVAVWSPRTAYAVAGTGLLLLVLAALPLRSRFSAVATAPSPLSNGKGGGPLATAEQSAAAGAPTDR
jgi:MFS family permease